MQNGGVFRSHMGAYLYYPSAHAIANVPMADIDRDAVARLQSTAYPVLALLFGLAAPTAVCGLVWNDWIGGVLVAGFAKSYAAQHTTFLVQVRSGRTTPGHGPDPLPALACVGAQGYWLRDTVSTPPCLRCAVARLWSTTPVAETWGRGGW